MAGVPARLPGGAPAGGRDLEAVPLFVAIRHVFLLGVHTVNATDWGYGWLSDRYFDRQLKFLREWEARWLGRPIPRSWRRPRPRTSKGA